jgi:hypothetical protein
LSVRQDYNANRNRTQTLKIISAPEHPS